MMHTSNGAVILVPTCKRPADLTRVLSSFTAKVSRALDGVVVGDNEAPKTDVVKAVVNGDTLDLETVLRGTLSPACFDTSMSRSETNGPRSFTRTTIDLPFSRFVTFT